MFDEQILPSDFLNNPPATLKGCPDTLFAQGYPVLSVYSELPGHSKCSLCNAQVETALKPAATHAATCSRNPKPVLA